MSILNRLNDENSQTRIQPQKLFAVPSNLASAKKKKALLDVGNTLNQKSVERNKSFSASKPSTSTKSFIKDNYMPRDIIRNINKENENIENKMLKQNEQKLTEFDVLNEASGGDVGENVYEEPACNKCDNTEDDYADLLFQDIQLTKKQIEDLAMIWENKPVVSEKDMNKLELDIPPICSIETPDIFDLNSSLFDCSVAEMVLSLPLPSVPRVDSY